MRVSCRGISVEDGAARVHIRSSRTNIQGNRMLYDAYEVQRSFFAGASKMASMGAGWLNNPANPFGYGSMGPVVAASLDVFAHASAPRGKPEFGIEEIQVGKSL